MRDKTLDNAILVTQGAVIKKMIHSGRFDASIIRALANPCKLTCQTMELLRLLHGVAFASLTPEEQNAAGVLLKDVTGVTVEFSADQRIPTAIVADVAQTTLALEAYQNGASVTTRHALATKAELKARSKAKPKIKVAK